MFEMRADKSPKELRRGAISEKERKTQVYLALFQYREL